MMKGHQPGVIMMSVVLAGCAAGPIWVKDGATPSQFEADQWDCKQKVMMMYGGQANMGFGHAILAGQDMQSCLHAKGYRQQPIDQAVIQHREEDYVPPSQQEEGRRILERMRQQRASQDQTATTSVGSPRYGLPPARWSNK